MRTPASVERDIRLTQQTPFGVASIFGNPDFQSEKLIAYELGHRAQFLKHFSVDIAAFYNEYDDLRTIEPVAGNPLLLTGENKLRGETYGIEVGPTWEICDWWRLSGAYSFLQIQLHRKNGSLDPNAERDEGRSPQHQFTVRSSWDLPWHLELDSQLRYADQFPDLGIPSYLVMDVRLGWRPPPIWNWRLLGKTCWLDVIASSNLPALCLPSPRLCSTVFTGRSHGVFRFILSRASHSRPVGINLIGVWLALQVLPRGLDLWPSGVNPDTARKFIPLRR